MSSTFNKTARDFAEALKNAGSSKTTPYDVQAEVKRVEGNTAWVHIPGGIDETPVQLTTNAKKGDIVQVRVSGGRAWLYGNTTSPPTDDTKAVIAEKKAIVADEHATNAVTSAMMAQQYADIARSEASSATTAANQAWGKAGEAATAAKDADDKAIAAGKAAKDADDKAVAADKSATDAYNAATAAQWQLGAVEDVVGTLEWIATHAIYKITNDTTPETGKWYYSLTPTLDSEPTVFNLQSGKYYHESDVYTQVEDPVDEDLGNYYEYDSVNDVYFLTEDETVDPEKTYYTLRTVLVADRSSVIDSSKSYYTVEATVMDIPSGESLIDEDVYEIDSYDKTVRDYINTHLALDQNGLHITDGTLTNRIDISQTNGMVMYVAGKQIAKYGPNTVIGDPTNYHIEITAGTPDDPNDPAMLSFVTGNGVKVAYMSGEVLNIPRVVVVDSLQIGRWIWDGQSNDMHLTLRWLGTRQNT